MLNLEVGREKKKKTTLEEIMTKEREVQDNYL